MKKIILLIVLITSLASCKKDKGDCYQCRNRNGTDAGVFCNSDGHEQDAEGNDIDCIQIH